MTEPVAKFGIDINDTVLHVKPAELRALADALEAATDNEPVTIAIFESSSDYNFVNGQAYVLKDEDWAEEEPEEPSEADLKIARILAGDEPEPDPLFLACRSYGHDYGDTAHLPVSTCVRCKMKRTLNEDGSRTFTYPPYLVGGESS